MQLSISAAQIETWTVKLKLEHQLKFLQLAILVHKSESVANAIIMVADSRQNGCLKLLNEQVGTMPRV